MTSTKKVSSKKKISLSKTKEPVLTLRSYGFDKKQLKKVAKDEDFEVTKPSELTDGRRHKRNVNKELLSIKRVHTDNKRSINQFKKDIINHDAVNMQEYLDILLPTFHKLSTSIVNVEEALVREEQKKQQAVASILDNYKYSLGEATTEKQCEKVAKLMNDDISKVDAEHDDKLWPSAFQNLAWQHIHKIKEGVDDLTLDTALKIKQIKSGKLPATNGVKTKPEDKILIGGDSSKDTELIDELEKIGGHAGWTVSIGFNGISIYQDSSSNLSLRAAISAAIKEHKQNTI